MKKLPYIEPEMCVVELMVRSHLLETSVPVEEEETQDQW